MSKNQKIDLNVTMPAVRFGPKNIRVFVLLFAFPVFCLFVSVFYMRSICKAVKAVVGNKGLAQGSCVIVVVIVFAFVFVFVFVFVF